MEKQVPPPEAPAPKRLFVVRARSTAVAVPPGKRNGWEHQDLRRRHLLVRETGNSPPHADQRRGKAVRKAFGTRWQNSSIVPLVPLAPNTVGRVWHDWGAADRKRESDSTAIAVTHKTV